MYVLTDIQEEFNRCSAPEAHRGAEHETPNMCLFRQMVDKVRRLHDREIHLTDEECAHFLHVLKNRERDREEHPLPFDAECCNLVLGRQTSTVSGISGVSLVSGMTTQSDLLSGTVSQRSSMSHLPHRLNSEESVAYLLAMEREQSKETMPDVQSDVFSMRSSQKQKAAENNSETTHVVQGHYIPKWLCFAKSVTSSQIILSVIPASFTDYCHLQGMKKTVTLDDSAQKDPVTSSDHEKSGQEKFHSDVDSAKGETTAKSKRVNHLVSNTSIDSGRSGSVFSDHMPDETNSSEKAQEVKDRKEETKVGLEEDIQNSSKEDMDAKSSKEEKKIPEEVNDNMQRLKCLPIPVYVFNCPLNMITEQFVNKWTYKRPTDVFLDLKFETELDDSFKQENESPVLQDNLESETKSNELKVDQEVVEKQERTKNDSGSSRSSGKSRARNTSDGERVSEGSATFRGRLRAYRDSTSSDHAFGDQTDAKEHCDNIAEEFSKAFAIGR